MNGHEKALDFITPLFVPGNRPERFEKAASSGADAIIVDLEDAVPIDAKDQARSVLRAAFAGCPVLVRINGLGTPWHADDLAAVSKLPFEAVVVPKAELSDDFIVIASGIGRRRPIVALIETARGVAQARAISRLEGITRIAFGTVDYCVEIGCAHTREALLSARSELVFASRLVSLVPPLDGATTSIGDEALLRDDSRYARELGFGGKLRQIGAFRTGFLPDADEVSWARKVLASGVGAAVVDGVMVDEPVRMRARSILARAGNPLAGL